MTTELTPSERLRIIRKALLSNPVRDLIRDLIGAGYWNLNEEEEFFLIEIIEDWGDAE
jgi:hypothetical protein